MQLAGDGVFGPPRDRDEAIAVLRAAVDAGVDHIDTAQYYGPGVVNQLIREALLPYPEGLALVSKVAARRDKSAPCCPSTTPISSAPAYEDNLKTLGVEQLTAVNLRVMDKAAPDERFVDQLGALVAARDDGLDRRNRDQQREPPTPDAGGGGHRNRLRAERLQSRGPGIH